MFLGLAGAEDARIKAGGGAVERSTGDRDVDLDYSKNYAKLKRAMRPGGEIEKEVEQKKKEQAPFRAALEAEIKQVIEEEMRHR